MVRIVTVDDQAGFREAVRAVVARTPGFQVVGESADGATAQTLVRRLDPDLVMVDVCMAETDGIEAARRLSAEDPTRLVVLMTGSDVRPLSELAAASGVAALLSKQWLTPRLLRGLWSVHRRR